LAIKEVAATNRVDMATMEVSVAKADMEATTVAVGAQTTGSINCLPMIYSPALI
jgi:hypothetical protein